MKEKLNTTNSSIKVNCIGELVFMLRNNQNKILNCIYDTYSREYTNSTRVTLYKKKKKIEIKNKISFLKQKLKNNKK